MRTCVARVYSSFFVCLFVCLLLLYLLCPLGASWSNGLGLNYKQIRFSRFLTLGFLKERFVQEIYVAVFAHLKGCFDYFGILQSRARKQTSLIT